MQGIPDHEVQTLNEPLCKAPSLEALRRKPALCHKGWLGALTSTPSPPAVPHCATSPKNRPVTPPGFFFSA